MSILINKNTKVITQGITGKTGQFHTRMCREYANGKQLLRRRRQPEEGRRGLRGHSDLRARWRRRRQATGATVSVIYVPPPFAAAAIDEAVDADLDLVICITEGIPVRDMIRTRDRMQGTQDAAARAELPGRHHARRDQDRHHAGPHPQEGPHRRGVALRHADLRGGRPADRAGPRPVDRVGIGGDPVNGLKHIDVLQAVQRRSGHRRGDHDRRDRRHRRGRPRRAGSRTT